MTFKFDIKNIRLLALIRGVCLFKVEEPTGATDKVGCVLGKARSSASQESRVHRRTV